jgi:predicted DNA-binding transcriptional regulator YafY
MRIQATITGYQLLEIEYNSLHNKETKRIIEPFALYSTQENWLLIAFCRLRNEFRAFRIDCMRSLNAKEEVFEPHNMTLEEYFEICKQKYRNTPDTPLS